MKLGIIIFVGGLYSFVTALKKKAVDKVKYCVPSAVSSLLGAAMILVDEELPAEVLALAVGGTAIFESMYNILNKAKCTEKIKGKYIGFKKHYIGRGVVKYRPKFVYIVSGQTFENVVLDSLFQGKVNDTYEVENKYDIYMNPENNNKIVSRKNISIEDIVLLIFGLMFISVPFILN